MEINRSKIATAIRFVWRHLFGVTCVAFILYMCFGEEYSLKNIVRLHAQEAELRREIATYKDSINNFERRIDEINVDSETLERYAREKMHMHKENEDLYLFDK